MSSSAAWEHFRRQRCVVKPLELTLDYSRAELTDGWIQQMEGPLGAALRAMDALEAGAIANPDENRMVGHYWLRAPHRAPTRRIAADIETTLARIRAFAADVHAGRIRGESSHFARVVSIGIGGSALGPMFVADALGLPGRDRVAPHFIDNTDPDGFERLRQELTGRLGETLVLVISKSGSTPEPRNALLTVRSWFEATGLRFARRAVAITGEGSQLDRQAADEGWLARFPMWDWVGGRTSQTSAVGLLPAALQGLDVDALLAGAAACDEATRSHDVRANPAALLALAWHRLTDGRGAKDMVILPYKDRLLLLSRYLQQLVMESLGKQLDSQGRRVEQGIAVYGNKGSTDQHAYVQQLRDGLNNFFVVFIRVLQDTLAESPRVDVEPGVTSGDYLDAFLLGTRGALSENGRASLTLTLPRVDERGVGALIALFERAVGLYASLINVNAYHQPGVEAGKKAAAQVLQLQRGILAALSDTPLDVAELARRCGVPGECEQVYEILRHLAANGRARGTGVDDPETSTWFAPAAAQ
ncbi:MAG: Glucose-6-phosphate isomerase [Phycisphaerae bacterium]|nr:Glucose-6-phosphate isomerase [Phycisphaerae bacterium]